MLNESLIEQFTRDCPSTKILVSKAWPLLTLESRLQLIDKFADNHLMLLLSLIMRLKSVYGIRGDSVVRIWALKYIGETPEELDDEDINKMTKEIFCEDAYTLQKKVKNDESEIVNKFIKGDFSGLLFTDFPKISQEARLIRLRHIYIFETDLFLNNIEMLTSSIPQTDLIECLDEIIGNIHKYGFMLGNIKIEQLNKAWSLLSGLDKDVAYRLARILPINSYVLKNLHSSNLTNGTDVKAELFLNLSQIALFWVLKTNKDYPTKELLKLAKIINSDNSDRFDKYVRELAQEINPEMEPIIEGFELATQTGILSKLKKLIKS